MPELPEVQTIVRELAESGVIGLTITQAQLFWPKTIANLPPDLFCQQISAQKIEHISRRGKFLVFHLTNDTLLVHLRMTGKFLLCHIAQAGASSHERVRLYLSDGRVLSYEDQRKFGRWHLTSAPTAVLQTLGVEPLSAEFSLAYFSQLCQRHHATIKPFLLNQRYIAGLGNIYVDEALWLAKIHPLRSTASLSKNELKQLHSAIKEVLQQGVANIGTSLGAKRANYYSVSGRRGENQQKLQVFRRQGLPCQRCGQTLVKLIVGQRGTHICPNCQKISPK